MGIPSINPDTFLYVFTISKCPRLKKKKRSFLSLSKDALNVEHSVVRSRPWGWSDELHHFVTLGNFLNSSAALCFTFSSVKGTSFIIPGRLQQDNVLDT